MTTTTLFTLHFLWKLLPDVVRDKIKEKTVDKAYESIESFFFPETELDTGFMAAFEAVLWEVGNDNAFANEIHRLQQGVNQRRENILKALQEITLEEVSSISREVGFWEKMLDKVFGEVQQTGWVIQSSEMAPLKAELIGQFPQFRRNFIHEISKNEKVARELNLALSLDVQAGNQKILELVEQIRARIGQAPQNGGHHNPLPHHLTTPPFMPPKFLGREEELQSVHDKLFGGENFLMLVNGQGGIGKTSFAAKYWERYEKEYTHLAFLFVGNGITDALLTLADALQLSFPPDMLNEAKLQQLIYRISNLDKPCLLILDNANEEKELNAHILSLRQCPNCHILLTSRLDRYKAAEKHAIGALPLPLALQLFREHYELLSDAEIPLFEEVYKAVAGNTLVLELLAKNLNNFNNKLKKRYTLAQLLDDLQINLLRLSQSEKVQTAYQAKGTGWRNETPEAIISGMYELSELEEAERKLLSIFAVLPAEHIEFEVLENLLQSSDFDNLDQILLSLVQKGWVEENEKGYKVSPVIQAITRHKQPNLLTDCQPLMDSLIAGMSPENLDQGHYEQAEHCAYFAQNMVSALQATLDKGLAILCQNMGNYHSLTGNLSKAKAAYEQMMTIFQSLANQAADNPNFKNGLAVAYHLLGDVYMSLGNVEMALDYFQEFNNLMKHLYKIHPNNESFMRGLWISYEKLGAAHKSLGKLKEALGYFQIQVELIEASYVGIKNSLAISYQFMGDTLAEDKNLDADINFQTQVELIEASYVGIKNSLAISYQFMGDTLSEIVNLDAAMRYFQKFNELTRELNESYPTNVEFKRNFAISYSRLGVLYTSLGDLEAALKCFQSQMELSDNLHNSHPTNVVFKNDLAVSYQFLGNTYLSLNKEGALEYFEKYRLFEEQLYMENKDNVEFKNGFAISCEKLGQFYRDKKQDKDKAKAYFLQAEALWKELVRDAPQYVQFQQFLGEVQRDLAQL